MAKKLQPPFDYSKNLIGEEIVYRTLIRQMNYALEGLYGMTWDAADQVLLGDYYYKSQLMRTEFSIPPDLLDCNPDPPCIWNKEEDSLSANDFCPVFFKNLPGLSLSMEVLTRTDEPNQSGYQTGDVLLAYVLDQDALDPAYQDDFLYYQAGEGPGSYTGKAVFRTQTYLNDILEEQFDYLFDLATN